MKKDKRDPDRKYIFPNQEMVDKEAERNSKDVQKQKGPTIDDKDKKDSEK